MCNKTGPFIRARRAAERIARRTDDDIVTVLHFLNLFCQQLGLRARFVCVRHDCVGQFLAVPLNSIVIEVDAWRNYKTVVLQFTAALELDGMVCRIDFNRLVVNNLDTVGAFQYIIGLSYVFHLFQTTHNPVAERTGIECRCRLNKRHGNRRIKFPDILCCRCSAESAADYNYMFLICKGRPYATKDSQCRAGSPGNDKFAEFSTCKFLAHVVSPAYLEFC